MIVDMIRESAHPLNEMLHSVPLNVFMRRLDAYFKGRFPKYAEEIDKAFGSASVYRSNIEMEFDGILGEVMHEDTGFWEGVKSFCRTMGYSCGGCNDSGYILLSMSMDTVPTKRFSDTDYNDIYIRYTGESPDLIRRIGFRQRGHFYAYAIGRDVSLVYRVSQELGLEYTQRQILEKTLETMKEQGSLFGRYVYAFKHSNVSYIDPCDSFSFPEIGDDEIKAAVDSLKGRGNDVTLYDMKKTLSHLGAEFKQPVTIYEAVPVRNIAFLRDAYSDDSPDIAEEADTIDRLLH